MLLARALSVAADAVEEIYDAMDSVFVSEAEADIQRRSVYEFLDPNAPSGCLQVSAAEFDLHPPVILMKGSPFIISNRSQREVISDLSWKSIVYIWGGPIATLLGVWGILKHLQWWGVLP